MPLALLLADDPDSVQSSKVHLRDRLAARRHAGRIDRALARGVAPDSDAALQLRARTLVGPRMRRMLADRLEWTMSGAVGVDPRRSTRLPANRHAVFDAAGELEAIAGLLRAPGAVGAAGVARVVELLGDGAGPLYVRDAEPDLRSAASAAIAGLESA